MNYKVQQMAIESQRINCLRRLRKIAGMLNQIDDEFGQINWPIGFEESIDMESTTNRIDYLKSAIANYTEAINS
jgi:hypothetical protein